MRSNSAGSISQRAAQGERLEEDAQCTLRLRQTLGRFLGHTGGRERRPSSRRVAGSDGGGAWWLGGGRLGLWGIGQRRSIRTARLERPCLAPVFLLSFGGGDNRMGGQAGGQRRR